MKSHPVRSRPLATLVCASALALLAGCAGSEVEAAKVQSPTVLAPQRTVVRWKDLLGVNAHFLWFDKAAYSKQMDQLKKLGLEWVRVDLHWDRHEPQKEQFRLGMVDELTETLEQKNLKSVFYLVGSAPFVTTAPADAPNKDQYPPRDPKIFAERMAMLAKRYPGVDAWQVWNEPNLPSYWYPKEDAKGYGQLLEASARALKQAAPGKPVVMGGMAYYSQMPRRDNALMLEKLGEMGAFQLNTIVAYHPYSEYPEGDDPKARDFIERARMVNARLRGAGVKTIWATEWGWSSYNGPRELQALIGEDGQADYVLRRLTIMSTLDYDRIFLFALSDLDSRASARDRGYGLLDLKGQPKPVYQALQRFLNVLGPEVRSTEPIKAQTSVPSFYSVTWKRPDNKKVWLFWGGEAGSATIPAAKGTLIDPFTGGRETLTAKDGRLSVPVRTSLRLLELE